mgnify:FL=1|jgi:hypothetical protein
MSIDTLLCPGLDKLRGFAIDSARLIVPKEEDGTNLRGTATLPNHSVFTFALVYSLICPSQTLSLTSNLIG